MRDFSLPPPELALDPWARWVLLALYRHVDRQAWVGEIAERVGASLSALDRNGALAHPEIASGPVPGEPGWTFRFHGMGCALEHEDGTDLDVDFVEGTTEWIDPYFFTRYLESAPRPELPEARLRRPRVLSTAWQVDLPTLRNAALIEGTWRVRLTPSGRELASTLASAWSRHWPAGDDRIERAWAAWQLDDAGLTAELLGSETPATVRARADSQLNARVERLSANAGGRHVFAALADLGKKYAAPHLDAELMSDVPPRQHTALELIRHWADTTDAERVWKLALSARNDLVRVRAVAFGLRLNPRAISDEERKTVLAALERATVPVAIPESALLRTLLAPELGLDRLGALLAADQSAIRDRAACALAVLKSPEAIALLKESETTESAQALALLRGEQNDLVSTFDWMLDDYADLISRR